MLNRAIVVAAACWLGACQFDEGPDQVLPVTVPPAPGGTGGAGGAAGPDGGFSATGGRAVQPPAPAGPWMEHWFEHNQFLNVVDEDENIVLYFDDAVNLASKTWLAPYLSRLWAYAKATYGAPGDPRLYAVFHTGRYGGAHSASLFDSTHDFRNVIDCGSATDVWSNPDSAEIPTGIAGTLLVQAPYGVESDPAIALSGYHFTEIFNYDALKMLGMPEVASRVLASNLASTSDSPRVDTHWFRDWYYPLWQQGGAAVFGRYFQLLYQHYPKVARADGRGMRYSPQMNWGEYVHFMSGAAGKDLKALATTAFSWNDEREQMLVRARVAFPAIRY